MSNLRKIDFKEASLLIYLLLIKFLLLILASQIPFFGGVDFGPNLGCSEGALPVLYHFSTGTGPGQQSREGISGEI